MKKMLTIALCSLTLIFAHSDCCDHHAESHENHESHAKSHPVTSQEIKDEHSHTAHHHGDDCCEEESSEAGIPIKAISATMLALGLCLGFAQGFKKKRVDKKA